MSPGIAQNRSQKSYLAVATGAYSGDRREGIERARRLDLGGRVRSCLLLPSVAVSAFVPVHAAIASSAAVENAAECWIVTQVVLEVGGNCRGACALASEFATELGTELEAELGAAVLPKDAVLCMELHGLQSHGGACCYSETKKEQLH